MTSRPIFQAAIPASQRLAAARTIPAMQPVGGDDWLTIDAVYSDQIAEKQRLLAVRPSDVIAVDPDDGAPLEELLAVVCGLLSRREGFVVTNQSVTCPDGRCVPLHAEPLNVLSQILQEDVCLLRPGPNGHVLTSALLCFPAAWTLAEKRSKTLMRIHKPVATYPAVADRVQRFFDAAQPEQPLWRANLLRYDLPDLYQPHSEGAPRPVGQADSPYERSERQTVLRLPRTGVVVFAIHTTMIRRAGDSVAAEAATDQ